MRHFAQSQWGAYCGYSDGKAWEGRTRCSNVSYESAINERQRPEKLALHIRNAATWGSVATGGEPGKAKKLDMTTAPSLSAVVKFQFFFFLPNEFYDMASAWHRIDLNLNMLPDVSCYRTRRLRACKWQRAEDFCLSGSKCWRTEEQT